MGSEKVYILQVKPDGVGPHWWPHTNWPLVPSPVQCETVTYHFATVTDAGGWAEGIAVEAGVPEEQLRERLEEWYEEHGGEDEDDDQWPWTFRVLVLPEGG